MIKKKSLGQNFLNSPAILKTIADAGSLEIGERVLEIGPGEGTLTRELLSRGAQVTAVEMDDRLIPILEQTFTREITSGQFRLIHGDILEMMADELGLDTGPWKLIANIPYYITGAIIRKFFETENQPIQMVLLVQKEVADRIIAHDTKESILSLSVKAYGKPELIQKVPRGAFTPAPNVDSAIITISDISKKFFSAFNEEQFFELVRAGFKSRRKMLVNNLSFSKEKNTELLLSIGVPSNARAEDLTLENWRALATTINSKN
jgi:16S rRNA (adenine1518-N6/adenine1519-N6)-dimethyltransferase